MDHVHPVLERDPNDIVLRQISGYGGQPFPHLISLVGLLPVSRHLVLDRVDGDGLHGQFVCGAEDPNGDLSTVGDEDLFERASVARLLLTEGLDAAKRRKSALQLSLKSTLVSERGYHDSNVRMGSGSAGPSGSRTRGTGSRTGRSRSHGGDDAVSLLIQFKRQQFKECVPPRM